MFVKTIHTYKPNQRTPRVIEALRWFVRFSQFYGEYNGRSLQARQRWVAERAQKEQAAKRR